jgi:hypothetical protein
MSEIQKLFEEDPEFSKLNDIPTDEVNILIDAMQSHVTKLSIIFISICIIFVTLLILLGIGILHFDIFSVLVLVSSVVFGIHNIREGRATNASILLLHLLLISRTETQNDEA